MEEAVKKLVGISRIYGSNPEFVIAGGGNTSYKNEQYIWVKASGYAMADITADGFVQLYRDKLQIIGTKAYSEEPHRREAEVKNDLLAARVSRASGLRPSVETSLHEVIRYAYVVHTHPTLVNGLMCSLQAEEKTRELFGDEVLYVPYAIGYDLFKRVKAMLENYRSRYHREPHMILLQNHGVFVGADQPDAIVELYDRMMGKIREVVNIEPPHALPENPGTGPLIEGISAFYPGVQKMIRVRHSAIARFFYESEDRFSLIVRPVIPDIVVYCGPAFLYSGKENPDAIYEDLHKQISGFREKYGKFPKTIVVKNFGVIGMGQNEKEVETTLDVFDDFMKIVRYSMFFGGPHPLTEEQIAFLDHWEVEQYRRKISQDDETGTLG